MSQKIIFCKGLPASGKSTWAKQYCIDCPNFKRVNKDDIRDSYGNPPFSRKFEDFVLKTERELGEHWLKNGYSLIVDDTNFAPYHWEFWQQYAISNGIKIETMIFNTPVEECIQRDSQREKSVGKLVIIGMYKKYIEPNI